MVYFFAFIFALFYINLDLQITFNNEENKFVLNLVLYNNLLLFKIFIFINDNNFYYKINSGNIKSFYYKKNKNNKINSSKNKKNKFYLPKISIEKVNLDIVYGKKDDAFNTAILCGLFNAINSLLDSEIIPFIKIKEYNNKIIPGFNNDEFKFNFSLSIKKSTFSILIIILRILFLNLIKRGANNVKHN